jgi:hypothetical protein
MQRGATRLDSCAVEGGRWRRCNEVDEQGDWRIVMTMMMMIMMMMTVMRWMRGVCMSIRFITVHA